MSVEGTAAGHILRVALAVAGFLIVVASSTVTGYRLHRWALIRFPWAQRIPKDFGPWVGLLTGLAAGWSLLYG